MMVAAVAVMVVTLLGGILLVFLPFALSDEEG
jgi:hypothetical protein